MKIKVITFNTRHGEIDKGIIDVIKQASELKKYNPDIILLQEVDMYTDRINNIDELQIFKNVTGLKYSIFGGNINYQNGGYGNAILSKYPILKSENYVSRKYTKENRGLLYAELFINGKKIDVYNTHFPIKENERIMFAKQINRIIENKRANIGIIGGDFNPGLTLKKEHKYEVINKKEYDELNELKKIFKEAEFKENTYSVAKPEGQFDRIMYYGDLELINVRRLDEKISDHYPVISEFEIIEN